MPPSTATSFLVLRDSGTHGLGVFATQPISIGTLVITHRGVLRPSHEVIEGMRAMQVGHDLWLCQDEADDSADHYLNHSCEPNIGFSDGTLSMFALRDIAAGEELLWDYSTAMNEPLWQVRCACAAATCRGVISSFCDLPAAVQQRLRPIALAYLR